VGWKRAEIVLAVVYNRYHGRGWEAIRRWNILLVNPGVRLPWTREQLLAVAETLNLRLHKRLPLPNKESAGNKASPHLVLYLQSSEAVGELQTDYLCKIAVLLKRTLSNATIHRMRFHRLQGTEGKKGNTMSCEFLSGYCWLLAES